MIGIVLWIFSSGNFEFVIKTGSSFPMPVKMLDNSVGRDSVTSSSTVSISSVVDRGDKVVVEVMLVIFLGFSLLCFSSGNKVLLEVFSGIKVSFAGHGRLVVKID